MRCRPISSASWPPAAHWPSAHEPPGGRLFVWFQYVLPQHALSRLVLAATRVRAAVVQESADTRFSQALPGRHDRGRRERPLSLRQLQRVLHARAQGRRPSDRARGATPSRVRSTACVSEVRHDRERPAAAGEGPALHASTDLLAEQPWARHFEGGSFATIYLAPFNYHRMHMPLRGVLWQTVYVPGRLFSVNAVTAQHVPGLFARNERVLTLFDTASGSSRWCWSGRSTWAAWRLCGRATSRRRRGAWSPRCRPSR